ncbi:sugar phosphate isomerase/epimerase [Marinilongibacter aquaticus]|uniref:sugar phosphate isomerase/epimerase family protein n=1 Tax=Marinilongibacter aquaticus TaxID=2975157 RepID=UPI0021BD7629|nr:sugar phosphate isomerase/epimerase [Marinilongibacter aquaticus]UBM60625.1 sugar phosphate isomerase/epimerase [Marinilongibacter aquaticus]
MNRRDFIVKGGSALSLAFLAGNAFAQSAGTVKKFGCQLYSVRDLMPKDPIGTMEKLAGMGYKLFESYSEDPFWGMSPKECKKFLKGIGVKMISTHMGMKGVTEELAANAKEVGLEYIMCPYIGMQPNTDAWKKRAEDFNKAGEMCKKYGLKFGYHNHSYSFAFVSGMKGQMVLLENTDPDLVCFELDMCWSEAAGENTIAHLQKYGNRYELCHVKQLVNIPDDSRKAKQTDLADGVIDYTKLLRAAKDNGMKYYLVEQEQYPVDSITSMASDAKFMKNLVF